ncbi:MAG: S41 family peptidase [Clostridia bacterium]|nr:S41 family peptidase [Clostridia bacterium]
MKRKIELGTVIFFIVAAVMVSCIATYMYMAHMVERTTGKSEMFEKLTRVYQVINNRYVGEFDEDEAMDALLSGYVDGIDDYGVYLNKTSYLEFKNSAEGKASGIGATVKYVASTGYLKITRVRSGSPCEKAGIAAGDVITTIDGNNVSAMSYTDATNRLKAAVGTEIKLVVLRGAESLSKTVTVQEYKEQTVSQRLMVSNVGYIAISEFDTNTTADFKAAVEELKDKGASKFIFDVRNNTGGSLTSVTEILDYILPSGTLCSIKDKNGEEKLYSSDESCLTGEFAVLINGSTYSGGELFAAAFRDFEYGTLVGNTTFGKGMAQEIIPLGDDTALYLSTNLYYPPNGVNYDGVGVSPDVEVSLTADQEDRFYELSYEEDGQLQAAMAQLQ